MITTSERSSYLQKIGKGLTQWDFVSPWDKPYLHNRRYELPPVMFINHFLWSVLRAFILPLLKWIQKKPNSNKLGQLTWIQSIYWWRQVRLQNRHPHHDPPKTYGGSKYLCPVWIHSTENLITHPRKNFRINKHWYSKHNTKNPTRLEQIT